MFQHSVKFQILSEVSSVGEVFDKLVRARHVLSGQEGLLLCSHDSSWPTELAHQATWLAGCNTPEDAPIDKLVLGSHPAQEIIWDVDREARTVAMTVTAYPVYNGPFLMVRQVCVTLTKKQTSKLKAIKRFIFDDEDHPLTLWGQLCEVYWYCSDSKNLKVQDLRPVIFQFLLEEVGLSTSSQTTLSYMLKGCAEWEDAEPEEYEEQSY